MKLNNLFLENSAEKWREGEKMSEANKTGHWIHESSVTGFVYVRECACSECGYKANIEKTICSHCGAKMTDDEK